MELRFQAGGPESWSADAVIVFLSEDEKLEKAYPELLDAAPWMSIAPGMRDFHGKKGEMGLLSRISEALRIVDRRWATTKLVLPCISLSNAS